MVLEMDAEFWEIVSVSGTVGAKTRNNRRRSLKGRAAKMMPDASLVETAREAKRQKAHKRRLLLVPIEVEEHDFDEAILIERESHTGPIGGHMPSIGRVVTRLVNGM